MKKVLILATALAVGLPFLAFGQAAGYYDRSYTRLSYVKGDVYIQRAQDLGYEQGEVNLVLIEGDKIGTRDGRVEVQLGRRNYLRLDRDTLVDLVGLPRGDNDPTKFHILSGKIFVQVDALDREKNFEIHTPDASFYVLDEGLYRVDILGDQETEFMVYRGQAEAAGEEGSVLIQEGEMIVAANGRFTSAPVALRLRGDDFGAWQSSRDALYTRRTGQTYLPAEYSDYETELDDYGRWVYESSYGYVWTPTVSYADWRPYYNGRWVWYPIIGWTWVSYEPWGWCTYHYGRWGWRFGLGWYWIPHNNWHWGPAWVHWWHGYDHIGWCPLSYHNYPGVIANNYFYDRYNRDYFPANSRSLVVVQKNQLQNRRISQVALDGNALNRVGRISLRAAQPELRPALNRANDVALRAQKVINREGLRSVGKSFGNEGRRISSESLAAPAIRRSGAAGGEDPAVSRGRVVNGRELGQSGEGSGLRKVERSSSGNPPEAGSSRVVNERAIRPRGEDRPDPASPRVRSSEGSASGSGRRVENEGTRVSPSRRDGANDSARPSAGNRDVNPGREVSPSRPTKSDQPEKRVERSGEGAARPRVIKEFTQLSPQKQEGEGRSPSSLPSSREARSARQIEERPVTPRIDRERPAIRLPESTSPRADTPRRDPAPRAIKERGGSDRGAAPRSASPTPRSSSSRESSPVFRSPSTQSRSTAAPSRTISPSPRSSSAPSRRVSPAPQSYRAPSATSRSSSSAPRSFSAPRPSAPKSSAPSRSYSAPSRSSSSPSRSYSAPSRSSSSPSRSYSAPSRSSSSSSRSSSAPSRSSSGGSGSRPSGGSVRKK